MNTTKTFKPSKVEDVLKLLEEHGDDSKLIAGGTDIVIELRNEYINPKVMIDIAGIDELRYIEEKDGYMHLGAGVTFTDIVCSEILDKRLDGLKKSARLVGSPQIRNKGTIGGNICNGSPAADIVPPLLALDAVLTIKSNETTREVRLEDIFLGKEKVDLKSNELLVDIKFKKPREGQNLGFSKLGLRSALAISRICISVYLDLGEDDSIKDIKIASGALGVNGLREKAVEDSVRGKKLNQETMDIARDTLVKSVEERLKGRSSLEYKSSAVGSLLKEAVNSASGKTLS